MVHANESESLILSIFRDFFWVTNIQGRLKFSKNKEEEEYVLPVEPSIIIKKFLSTKFDSFFA